MSNLELKGETNWDKIRELFKPLPTLTPDSSLGRDYEVEALPGEGDYGFGVTCRECVQAKWAGKCPHVTVPVPDAVTVVQDPMTLGRLLERLLTLREGYSEDTPVRLAVSLPGEDPNSYHTSEIIGVVVSANLGKIGEGVSLSIVDTAPTVLKTLQQPQEQTGQIFSEETLQRAIRDVDVTLDGRYIEDWVSCSVSGGWVIRRTGEGFGMETIRGWVNVHEKD
jgi:hypothetical protein